ncbi:F-box protein CPR1 [Camellia lanceoleosa]|uniref:F-box protein CPR1 n=1 Tax=Camellia lanceoleosa TaxID=1840588 RepID=A0ACC0GMB4_9ERIC|nr:F-box protein CPR1 [Camellia lanceoleosa]
MANLSEEIIIEILSRLTITTLCRFRSVSKPWFSLISNPHFIKAHLNRNTIEHDRLILLSRFLFRSRNENESLVFVFVVGVASEFEVGFDEMTIGEETEPWLRNAPREVIGSLESMSRMISSGRFGIAIWEASTDGGCDALNAFENNNDVTKALHQYFQGKFPEGPSKHRWKHAKPRIKRICQRQRDIGWMSEPSSSKSDRFIL